MIKKCIQRAGWSHSAKQRLAIVLVAMLALGCLAASGCSMSSVDSGQTQEPAAQTSTQSKSDVSSEADISSGDEPVEEVQATDTSGLQEAVASAEAVDAGGYTKDSYAKFADQIAAAREVLADEACTQEQVDGALANLEAAYQTLTVKFNKKNYKPVAYSKIARNPDDYEGKQLKFSGNVVQVMEGDEETQIRLATDGEYDDIVLVGYDPAIMDKRVLEDDTVTVYGTSVGLITYESTMGGNITIPALAAEKITIDEEA